MKHTHLLVAIFLLLTPLAGCFDSSPVQGPDRTGGADDRNGVEGDPGVEWGPEVSDRASEWLRQNIRDEIYDQVYYHYWDLREHMEALQQDHSGIMRLSTIGRSVDGELDPFNDYGKLLLAEVTNLSDTTPKPQILIDGGHHGNEQLGMEVAMLLLDYLVTQYEEDAWVKEFVDSHDIFIFPMVNVDGNTRDTRANSNGVDLNRNYPFEWDGAGSGPASEPEVAANVELFEAHDFRLYISMHTGTLWFLTPWGYTESLTPDVEMYTRLEQELTELTGLRAGPAATELYIAKGTSLDYGYSLGMPSVTIEVDNEQWGVISVEEKQSRLTAAFIGSLYMMGNYPLFGAHPVLDGSSHPTEIVNGESFTLSLELNNTGFGPLVNGTFWLKGDGFKASPDWIEIAELGANNSTTLEFTVRPLYTGNVSVELEGSFRTLLIDGAPELLLSESNRSVVFLKVSRDDRGLLPGWSFPLGLLSLAVAAIAMQFGPGPRTSRK